MDVLNLIQTKQAKIGIIGLGYVGLPLAIEAAHVAFDVTGFDLSAEKVDAINTGKNYIADISDSDFTDAISKKKFRATSDFKALGQMDVIVICVPTPLNITKDPDMSYIENSSKAIAENMKKGTLVILESTTYPGTTEELVKGVIEKKGFSAGKDFYLVFSPERVDPGNEKFKTRNIPKVIGGIDQASSDAAAAFYGSFLEKTHIVSSPRAAEMTKLLENIFRIVNISMINELALLSNKMEIDIWEVINAASTKPYGFMPFYPGPGSGGHCIPVDPFYLSWKAKEFDFFTRFISLAGEINDQMPHFVVTKVISALNSISRSLRGSRILMLGVAYKKNINDLRESPAIHIIKDLQKKGVLLEYNDPFIPEIAHEGISMHSVEFDSKSLSSYDCVLIVTDHSSYDADMILKNSRLIVDTRNLIKSRNHSNVFRL